MNSTCLLTLAQILERINSRFKLRTLDDCDTLDQVVVTASVIIVGYNLLFITDTTGYY